MDGVDFQLLAALHEDGTQSHASLGRVVGRSPPAVAARLGRLAEHGVLQGFRADLHPALFGRTGRMEAYEGPFAPSDVDEALAVADVVWVAWKVDGGMTVMRYVEQETTPPLPHMGRPGRTIPGDRRPPAPPSRLTARVLAAVVADPRAGRDRLAAASGLSPKTCAKHKQTLMARGLVHILPRLGSLAEGGAVVYHAAVFGSAPPAAVGAAFGQAVLVNRAPGVQYWFCMAPDYPTALSRQRAAGAVGGEVHVTLNRTLRQTDDRLIRWLDAAP